MSKSPPAAPDYTQAALEQGAQSQQTAAQATAAAHPNTSSPWGSSTWDTSQGVDPATGAPTTLYNNNVTLSPQEGAILGAQQEGQFGQQALGANYAQGLGESGLLNPISTQIPTSAQIDPQAEGAAWNEYQTLNSPIFQQQTSQLQTQLQDQGLKPGDQAYETAMKNMEANQNTANSSAASQAYLTGVQAGGTEQGEDIAGLNANLGEQGTAANLLNSLVSGTQVQNPGANAQGGVTPAQPANLLGAAQSQGQSLLDQYNAQVGQGNATEETAGSIAGMVAIAL